MTVALLLPNGQVFMIEDVVSCKANPNGPHLRLYFKSGDCIQTSLPYFFIHPPSKGEVDWTSALKKEIW
jgi:hypothetical protein